MAQYRQSTCGGAVAAGGRPQKSANTASASATSSGVSLGCARCLRSLSCRQRWKVWQASAGGDWAAPAEAQSPPKPSAAHVAGRVTSPCSPAKLQRLTASSRMRLAASSRGLRGAATLRAASASQSKPSNQRCCFTSRALPCGGKMEVASSRGGGWKAGQGVGWGALVYASAAGGGSLLTPSPQPSPHPSPPAPLHSTALPFPTSTALPLACSLW